MADPDPTLLLRRISVLHRSRMAYKMSSNVKQKLMNAIPAYMDGGTSYHRALVGMVTKRNEESSRSLRRNMALKDKHQTGPVHHLHGNNFNIQLSHTSSLGFRCLSTDQRTGLRHITRDTRRSLHRLSAIPRALSNKCSLAVSFCIQKHPYSCILSKPLVHLCTPPS